MERTLKELVQMYPLVPIEQIEKDMAEIQRSCSEIRNQEWF
jgi:hypothetical protein